MIPNPLPCFSETAGRQVELHAIYKEKRNTEMLAYWALLADRQRVKKMLGQGWVSAPSRAKQRIKPGLVRFVCNPALGKWQHKVSSSRPASVT